MATLLTSRSRVGLGDFGASRKDLHRLQQEQLRQLAKLRQVKQEQQQVQQLCPGSELNVAMQPRHGSHALQLALFQQHQSQLLKEQMRLWHLQKEMLMEHMEEQQQQQHQRANAALDDTMQKHERQQHELELLQQHAQAQRQQTSRPQPLSDTVQCGGTQLAQGPSSRAGSSRSSGSREAKQRQHQPRAAAELQSDDLEFAAVDEYDPRKPEYMQAVSDEEASAAAAALAGRQAARLERFIARHAAEEDELRRGMLQHYEEVRGALRAERGRLLQHGQHNG